MNKKIFLPLLLWWCGTGVQAQDAKAMAIQADKNQAFRAYPCITLLDSTSVRIKDNGSGTFHIRRIERIQNEEGALQKRTIVYDYDPLTAEAEFQNVSIYRANGDTVNIDLSKAVDYTAPARMIYWGARQIMIEVGALKPGDIVDCSIYKRGFTYALLAAESGNIGTVSSALSAGTAASFPSQAGEDEDRFIPPMKGEFYDIIPFWSTQPTLRKVYRISIPKHRDMQYQVYQGTCATSVRYEQDQKVYTFALNDMLPPKREPNMLDLFDCAPKIIASSTGSWKEKSIWFSQVNENFGSFSPIPEAEKKVKEILKGKKTEMERIAALSHWVADNIRYSGITMGKGEGYTLHNLKMNYTDRCGVCKDIASTLVSFLRIAGFKAYPAMTMAGSRIEKNIPADHFNHCVTVVELSDGTLMPIDPTWIPFSRELWSSAEQQQNYLPGLPEGSDLCITPVSAPENHYLRMNAKTELEESGTLTGTVTISAEGYTDQGMRRIFTQGWENQWYNYIEQQLTAISPQAQLHKVDWGKDPRNYMAAPLSITLRFEIPDYAIVGENEILVKPIVMSKLYARNRAESRLDLTPETRKYGFSISCSQLLQLNETMILPKGYTLLNSKKEAEVKGSAAASHASYSLEGNKLTYHQELSLNKRVYTAEEWNDVREAVQNYRDFGKYLILHKQ